MYLPEGGGGGSGRTPRFRFRFRFSTFSLPLSLPGVLCHACPCRSTSSPRQHFRRCVKDNNGVNCKEKKKKKKERRRPVTFSADRVYNHRVKLDAHGTRTRSSQPPCSASPRTRRDLLHLLSLPLFYILIASFYF